MMIMICFIRQHFNIITLYERRIKRPVIPKFVHPCEFFLFSSDDE